MKCENRSEEKTGRISFVADEIFIKRRKLRSIELLLFRENVREEKCIIWTGFVADENLFPIDSVTIKGGS